MTPADVHYGTLPAQCVEADADAWRQLSQEVPEVQTMLNSMVNAHKLYVKVRRVAAMAGGWGHGRWWWWWRP